MSRASFSSASGPRYEPSGSLIPFFPSARSSSSDIDSISILSAFCFV